VHILWFVFPAGINALTALVSFGVSGIYLSFLLTVIGSMIARSRGWQPAGAFTLGRWAWPVSILAAGYLVLMLINIVLPSGLTSPRGALFNFDWITLAVVAFLLIIGAVYFFCARPDRRSGFRSDEGAGLPDDPAELPGPPALPAVAGTEPIAADPRP
jgi:amino acid transporter